MGSRASLDGRGKSRPPPGFDPRTVKPVASRYSISRTNVNAAGTGYGRAKGHNYRFIL